VTVQQKTAALTSPVATTSPLASCVLSLDGRIAWTGPGPHPLFSVVNGGDIVGTPFEWYWAKEEADLVATALATALRSGRATFVSRSARTWLRLSAVIDLRRSPDGEPLEFLVSMAPASDEAASPRDYQTLFDTLPVVVWTTHDPDAMVIVGNPASERRYGCPSGTNHSLSQPAEKVQHVYRYCRDGLEVPAERLPMQRAVKGEHVRDEEFEVRFHDGRTVNVILSASPMHDSAGNIEGCVCVEIDITERKRVEMAQDRLLACSRVTGQSFFEALVGAIAEILGACHVYVAESLPESPGTVHTLAAWIDGKVAALGNFMPRRTPCADVLKRETTFIPRGARTLRPDAEVIQQFGAEAYIGAPLCGSDGQVLGIIGVLHKAPMDDTPRSVEIVEMFAGRAAAEIERLRVEASLRKSEEEYRTVTDAIPALIMLLDTNARFRFVNAAVEAWFGIKPNEAKGKHLSEIIGVPAFAKIEGKTREAVRGHRQKFEAHIPYARVGSRRISAEFVPHIDGGQVRGFFALVTDISEQKAAADALSKSEAQFRTLFAHLPVGAALVDRQGQVLLENDLFSRLLPPLPPTLRGAPSVFDRACTAYAVNGAVLRPSGHPVRQALRGTVTRDVELSCRHTDGRELWVRMSGIPILNEGGVVTGALVVVADIHSEKLAEDRRSLLINELNHRVKNTLASVQSIASQTFRTSELTRDGLAAFEDRLLALSHAHNLLTHEHWEGADLKRLAALVLDPHDPGGNRLRVDGPNLRLKPPAALAFAMALHELATNAVKYGSLSVPGGRVDLTWHLESLDEVRTLHLAWRETGGPPVTVPARKGFGTRLIERSLAFELSSATSIRFEPEGVICEIDADLREITG
jgi:PAS domain S-box-containing protein